MARQSFAESRAVILAALGHNPEQGACGSAEIKAANAAMARRRARVKPPASATRRAAGIAPPPDAWKLQAEPQSFDPLNGWGLEMRPPIFPKRRAAADPAPVPPPDSWGL